MLLIGLWNSNKELENTIHNIGQLVLKELIKNIDTVFSAQIVRKSSKYVPEKYFIKKYLLDNELCLNFLFLDGFINCTGNNLINAGDEIDEIRKNGEVVVFYDDISLPSGKVLISYGKGSGRHNGAAGLDLYLNRNYWRVRVGVTKPENLSAKDFVLKKIDNKNQVKKIIIKLSFCLASLLVDKKTKLKTEGQIITTAQSTVHAVFK